MHSFIQRTLAEAYSILCPVLRWPLAGKGAEHGVLERVDTDNSTKRFDMLSAMKKTCKRPMRVLEEKVVIYLCKEIEDLQATGNVWAEPEMCELFQSEDPSRLGEWCKQSEDGEFW